MNGWDRLFWLFVGSAASAALVLVGIPFLLVARKLLAARPGRWSVRRWLAYLLLAADAAALAVVAVAFVAPRLGTRLLDAYHDYSRTYRLASPRVLAGVRFPAGSTVFMDGNDIDHGTVPVPTVIAGLPLVGDFVANHEAVAFGTLAVPADVLGVPCAPGRVSFYTRGSMSCVLGRGFTFVGHELAAGRPISIAVIEGFGRWLEEGTLARPERLFDVSWPAGSILSGIQDEAARPDGSPGLPDLRAEVCLLSDAAVPIPGAVLHGTLTYTALGEKRWVQAGCSHLDRTQKATFRDGYAEVGRGRYVQGERPGSDSSWSWSNGDGLDPVP